MSKLADRQRATFWSAVTRHRFSRRDRSRRSKARTCLRTPKAAAGFLLLNSAFCLSAFGQSYSIDWYKIAGGGGTSTGATYQVTGTIGQPDAGGAMTGGNYSLTGGFWSLIAVAQTPGAPTLTITQSGNTVKVFWPYPSAGWTLQQNSDLTTPANWSPSGGISNDGVNNYHHPRFADGKSVLPIAASVRKGNKSRNCALIRRRVRIGATSPLSLSFRLHRIPAGQVVATES